jgi:hypothetical protein
MFRTSILALTFGFTSVGVFAEDARQLTCSGTMLRGSIFTILATYSSSTNPGI